MLVDCCCVCFFCYRRNRHTCETAGAKRLVSLFQTLTHSLCSLIDLSLSHIIIIMPLDSQSGNNKQKKKKKSATKAISKHARAGLQLPVSKITTVIKKGRGGVRRTSGSMGVFLTAALEALVASVLEDCRDTAKIEKRTGVPVIKLAHLQSDMGRNPVEAKFMGLPSKPLRPAVRRLRSVGASAA
jgi:histone H3/H4